MSIRLHERTRIVEKAKIDVTQALIDATKEYDLTPGEILQILVTIMSPYPNYVLRMERHGNYEDKADEAID